MDEIVSALSFLQECERQLQQCVDGCDTSPGYWCQDLYERRNKAKEALEAALNTYVDKRIFDAIAALKGA